MKFQSDTTTTEHVRRRPRDRKASIAAIATDLFAARGFNTVRMEDIASQAGITVRALYRHYESKQELLSHIVNSSQRRFIAAFDPLGNGHPAPTLQTALERLANASVDSPHFHAVWQREARYLAQEDQLAIRQRLREMIAQLIDLIRKHRHGIPFDEARLRAWAVIAAVSGPHRLPGANSGTPAQLARLLVAVAWAIIDTPIPGGWRERPPVPARDDRGLALPSRREQILVAAAHLFRKAGYQSVNNNQIGQAAGVVGPAIYRHFDAKADILVALVARYYEWLSYEMAQALSAAGPMGPVEVLSRLVKGHVKVATLATDLVAVSVNDWLDLPPVEAGRLERIRNDYYAAWADYVAELRPHWTRIEAMVLVEIAIAVIEDTVRVATLVAHPDFARSIAALTAGALTLRE